MVKLPVLLIFWFLSFGCISVKAHTVKTDLSDVNLWSAPGRETSDQVGKIEKFEEVAVLGSKTLPNGQKWLKVRLRRSPGWRHHDQIGWVDSKFFREISKPSNDDQPTEAASLVTCKKCLNLAPEEQAKNVNDIVSLSRRLSPRDLDSSNDFIWPTTGPIRSGFGMRRHPILGIVKLHDGVDIAGANGKSVLAAKTGVIVSSKGGCLTGRKACNGGAGNMVVIDHGDGTQTKYLHLSSACLLPDIGTRVESRQKIACVGSTGASSGPHLHFSIVIKGRYINPLTILPRRNDK